MTEPVTSAEPADPDEVTGARAGRAARRGAAGAPRRERRRRWLLLSACFALLAAVASVLVERHVFPLGSPNRDESTYAAAATMARHGRFTLPVSTHDAFRPWASGHHAGRIVLKYLPPWPVALALLRTFGAGDLASPLMAALLVLLVHALTRELAGGDGPEPAVAAAAVALSPVVAFQGGTLLPYLFQLVLEAAAGLLLLRSRRGRPPGELVAAGLLAGMALFARQFDAVVTVAPFAIVAFWRRWRAAVPFALGAAVPAIGLLAFDAAVMGSPLRLPFTVTGPVDTLGFGDRGVFRGLTVPFSLANGFEAMVLNLAWMLPWVAGGPVLVAAAVAGWRWAPRSPGRTALATLALVIPIAFVPFWGAWAVVHFWPGTMTLGPFYHLALLLPLAVFGGIGVVGTGRRLGLRHQSSGGRPRRAAAVAVGLLGAGLAGTALLVPAKVSASEPYTRHFRAAARALRPLPADALVLLPDRGVGGFDSWTPTFETDPDLRRRRLYADDRGSNAFGLLDRFPGRPAYRVAMSPSLAHPSTVRAEPVTVVEGVAVDVTVALVAPGPSSYTYLVDRSHETSRRPVGSSATWRITAGSLQRPLGQIALGVDTGRGPRATRWEVRVPYRRLGSRVELLLPARGFRRAGGVWAERDVSTVVRVASWHIAAE